MIDVSNLKAPGWQRIVAELAASAEDDREYFARLVRILSQVAAARQAALFFPDHADGEPVEPRIQMIWPPVEEVSATAEGFPQGPQRANNEQLEAGKDVIAAARAAFESAQSRAFGLQAQNLYYTGGNAGGESGYVLAIPLPAAPVGAAGAGVELPEGAVLQPVGVVTLLVDARSPEAVRSTLAMAEVIAGYTHAHAARTALRKTRAASAALDLAARLIAGINSSRNFRGSCFTLVNDLARQFKAERVALGWVHDDKTKVVALSDVEHFDHRTAMVMKLARAMDECLDQEQPVVIPVPPAQGPGGDVVLSQAIVHAHRELAAAQAGAGGLSVCSAPLRVDDQIVGVVTMELARGAGGENTGHIDLGAVELLQAVMDLCAPVLKIRRSDDRVLPLRAWDSTLRAAAWVVGPKHTAWKLAGFAALCALLFVTFFRTTYRPGADAVLEPRERRVVSMPYDGILKRLGEGVEPGASVAIGQVLAVLDTTENELRLASAESRALQARKQADSARQERQPDKVVAAEEQEKQARAEADLFRSLIEKARIVSPIAGVIVVGDLKDRVGSTLKLGDPMMQIADLSMIVVTAKVDERDIALIRRAYDRTQSEGGAGSAATGQLTTKSVPDRAFDFTIERIVPLAVAAEGTNTFEVRCALVQTAPWFRPGMEGIAKFDTERRSLLWIGTRRIVDQLRLWLWW